MKIQLKSLHNGEYINFLKNVIILTQERPSVKKDLKTITDQLSTQVDKLDQVLELKGHALTEKIREADNKRDQAFNGLKQMTKAYLDHFDPTTVDHAKQVIHVIERFGIKIYKLNYQKETEYIEVLVSELEKLETTQGSLTSLGILNWVQELKALNSAFNELYLSRTTSIAEMGIHSVTSFRKETDEIYHQLIEVLTATIVFKTFKNQLVEDYKVVKQNLDELAKEHMDVIRLRQARAQDDSSDEEQTD